MYSDQGILCKRLGFREFIFTRSEPLHDHVKEGVKAKPLFHGLLMYFEPKTYTLRMSRWWLIYEDLF